MNKDDLEKTISQAVRDAEESKKGLRRLAGQLDNFQEQMILAQGYVKRKQKPNCSDSEALGLIASRFLDWCVCEATTSQSLHKEICCDSLRHWQKSQENVLADAKKEVIDTGHFSLAYSALRGLGLACQMYFEISKVLSDSELQNPAANMSYMAGELKSGLERLQNTYKEFIFIPEQHFDYHLADDWHPWSRIRVPLAEIIVSLPDTSKIRSPLTRILYKPYEGAPELQAKKLNRAVEFLLELTEKYERAKK